MPTIDINDVYPNVDEYWELVKRTLEEVFQKPGSLADPLKSQISNRPAEEQLLFYHAEPLDVAADIAGRRPITPHEVQHYRDLANRLRGSWQAPPP
jgi:hypothetical protein